MTTVSPPKTSALVSKVIIIGVNVLRVVLGGVQRHW